MFIILFLNHQEIHCVEERYVRNCKNHAWADKAIRKEYPGRENSSLLKICRPIIKKGKKPRMKALGRISRQRRPIRVTSLYQCSLLEIDPNERHTGGDRSADVDISLIRIWHSATFIDYCTITLSSQPLSNMRVRTTYLSVITWFDRRKRTRPKAFHQVQAF